MTKTQIYKHTALVVMLGLVAACGTDPNASNTKIVGGEEADADDEVTKSTVALVSPDGRQFCTGSLVTRTHVVTAAHCLAGYQDDSLFVAFGLKALPGEFAAERLRAAKRLAIHDEYSSVAMREIPATVAPRDIAFIELHEPAPAAYAPARLLGPSSELAERETLLLAGFGLTHWFGYGGGTLRKVEVTLTDVVDEAQEIMFGDSDGRSACMGDSGGPAFVTRGDQLYLIGVTSRGSSSCNSYGVYTDLRQYIDWMRARVREWRAADEAAAANAAAGE